MVCTINNTHLEGVQLTLICMYSDSDLPIDFFFFHSPKTFQGQISKEFSSINEIGFCQSTNHNQDTNYSLPLLTDENNFFYTDEGPKEALDT